MTRGGFVFRFRLDKDNDGVGNLRPCARGDARDNVVVTCVV